MKKTILKISKTGKIITAILTFFLASIGTWTAINQYQTKNISGGWNLKFTNESSSYKPYIGETHTQKVYFTQSDQDITGEGEKWEYNGKYLQADMHRKIEYKGTIDGCECKATYVLFGKLRESCGNVCLKISSDGKSLQGTFSGTAGNTKGNITGEKID